MPHLHLPIDHTDADLVLAANLAEIVGSEDLYVAWSHETGPGAIPEVEAVLREERDARRVLRRSAPASRVLAGAARPAVARRVARTRTAPRAARPSVRTLTRSRRTSTAAG